MNKRRLQLLIVVGLAQLLSCGLQLYLVHKNQVMQQEIRDAAVRLEQASRRVKAETERLEQLEKLLPPKPAPDLSRKL